MQRYLSGFQAMLTSSELEETRTIKDKPLNILFAFIRSSRLWRQSDLDLIQEITMATYLSSIVLCKMTLK
jgi:hypothetical protein